MKKLTHYSCLILFMFSVSAVARQVDTLETRGPQRGSLLIIGGGKVGPEIWNRFIEQAGGRSARIVLIPTAGDDATVKQETNKEKLILESFGVAEVSVLHTRDPKVANSESFVAPLRKATGVWLVGGRQWRLADAYLNTLTHKELHNLLNRGGIIAGTSAGATIQGSFLLRGDTRGNTVLVGDHLQGLGFIHNVAIDQHILRRNRQFDLVEVIRSRPQLLGIGIDESTAILVQKDTFEVLGDSYVAIYDSKQINTNHPFSFLSRGQRFDLSGRREIKNGEKKTATEDH